jgi:lysozyme family protein
MPGGTGRFVMVPVGPAGPVYRPDQDYFSVSLQAVHTPAGSVFSRFAPVVWSSVTHNAFDGEGGRKRLLGLYPNQAEGRPKFAREDRVTVIDLQLVPRIIAREELEVDFTLASVREKDFLAGILKAASDLAVSPATTFVSQIIPGAVGVATIAKGAADAASSVKTSIDELLDSDKVKSLGRYRQTLRAPLTSGLFAFISETEDARSLKYDAATNKLSNGKGEVRSPYAVVQLRCEATRPDWMSLPDMVQAWTRIRETKISGGDVAAAIEHFHLTAQTSPDLTPADAKKLTNAVKQKFAPELAGMESADDGDIGGMEASLAFFMQDSIADMESAAVDFNLPPHLADGPFQRCLAMILRHEGGFVDHPADRGGPTNRGVTQETFNKFLRAQSPDLSDADLSEHSVRDITDEQIAEIYYQGYWRPARCVDLANEALAAVVFDAAVNHGPRQALRLCQQGAGMSAFDCDGLWGPQTRGRVAAASADTVGLIDGMLLARERFYRQIVQDDPSQGAFLRGWMNRLENLKTFVAPLLVLAPAGQDTESALLDDTLETAPLRAAEPDFGELEAANASPVPAPGA